MLPALRTCKMIIICCTKVCVRSHSGLLYVSNGKIEVRHFNFCHGLMKNLCKSGEPGNEASDVKE